MVNYETYIVGADFTSALTTPTGLNVYKNMTQQSGTTPSGSNVPAAYSYKYATPLGSCNNHGNLVCRKLILFLQDINY